MSKVYKLLATICASATVFCAPAPSAHGDVTVVPGAGATIVASSVTNGTDGVIVAILAYGSPAGTVYVYADDPTDRIEGIVVQPQEHPPFTASQLSINLIVQPKPDTDGQIKYLGSIIRDGDDGDLWIGQVNVQGDIGKSTAPHATILEAQVVGSVTAVGSIASDIVSLGSTQASGSITRIEASNGSILGDVVLVQGLIDTVMASSASATADIGSPSDAVYILSKFAIKRIEAKNSIYANIDATYNGGSASSDILYIKTTLGSLNGSVKGLSIGGAGAPNGLEVATDLNASISLSGAIRDPVTIGGSVPAGVTIDVGTLLIDNTNEDGRISIDGSLDGLLKIGNSLSGAIDINTLGGLTGQIIINAANTGGSWNSLVSIGGPPTPEIELGPSQPSPLTAPYYEVLSSQLGGGAVGLVPFHLHDTSCDPANNPTTPGTLVITALPTTPITATLYGPVRTNATTTDTDQPIIFEKQLISGYEDETEKVSIAMKRGGDTGWSRQTLITQKSDTTLMPGIYRIRPRLTGASRLFCDQLNLTTPPSVADFEYWVNLLEDCNSNGIADVDDIAAHPWWDDWGLDGGLGANGRLDQCEWTGCPADVDFNGFVNGDDFDVFSEWFEAADGDADFNYDGFVNGDDYDLFAAAFNGAC